MKSHFRYLLILAELFFVSVLAHSQIVIAPTSVYLNDVNKTGFLVMMNPTRIAKEVTVTFVFGYPMSDSTGTTFLYRPDSTYENYPSAVDWVFSFPKRFVLLPNQNRTVRFAVRPPQTLANGEYWARPVVTSRDIADASASTNDGNGISTKVDFVFETILALSYRHGAVSTGIEFSSARVTRTDDSLFIFSDFTRKSTAAYIGYFHASLSDGNNDVVREIKKDIAVYYELHPRDIMDIGGLPSGAYKLQIEINTDRNEGPGSILHGNSAQQVIDVHIP